MVSDVEIISSPNLSHFLEPPLVETGCGFNTCPTQNDGYALLLDPRSPRNPPSSADTSTYSTTNLDTILQTPLNYSIKGPALEKNMVSDGRPLRGTSISSPSSRAPAKFTLEEDQLILRLRGDGRTWKQIATKLPRRSPGALQVRFSTKLKFKSIIGRTDIVCAFRRE